MSDGENQIRIYPLTDEERDTITGALFDKREFWRDVKRIGGLQHNFETAEKQDKLITDLIALLVLNDKETMKKRLSLLGFGGETQ